MAYITEGDLENFILQDIDASFSSWITDVIASVEAYIDWYCGTDFVNSASGDNFYDGSGHDRLNIEPCQSVSAVYILSSNGNVEQTLGASDYNLYPLNSTIKTSIVLTGESLSAWPERSKSVKVTGVFGYNTAPLPVKMAGIKLASKLINNGLRGGQVTAETLGSYNVSFKDIDESKESMEIKEILNQYRVISLE